MKLDHYISELLYKYDCVIVPGLGGFVANYKSATIQPIQNTFSPPSKSISFNKNLNSSDGLLTNFVAQKEGVNFDVSTQKIENYVSEVSRNLRLKKRVFLENLGTLFLDAENRVQFEPKNTSNYLLASYGLSVFQKQPIKRATIEEKIAKTIINKTPLIMVKDEEKKSKKWMYAAALIFIAFGAGWMTNNTDLSADLNYANLNPFSTTIKSVYTPVTAEKNYPATKEPATIKSQINKANQNASFVAVNLDETEHTVIVRLNNEVVAEPVTTLVKTSKQELHYHIVGGCFSEKKYAKIMVDDLKAKGFDSFIIGKRKGLWAVSFNSFLTREEAVSALDAAQNLNSKAWILNQ